MEYDLLNIPEKVEQNKHKLKRSVPHPNSYFLKIKCAGCGLIAMAFSNSQLVISCTGCSKVIAKPTGGKIKISEGCEFSVLGQPKKK